MIDRIKSYIRYIRLNESDKDIVKKFKGMLIKADYLVILADEDASIYRSKDSRTGMIVSKGSSMVEFALGDNVHFSPSRSYQEVVNLNGFSQTVTFCPRGSVHYVNINKNNKDD